ncbi:MAG TPA: M20/M25/M40 family metallo-hydrolase [Longimicrobiales bacterium]|nr:M20/M25/M40 family metallo-hydrolase [Longimicrobiales bacterium]
MKRHLVLTLALFAGVAARGTAQSLPAEDPILRRIWAIGMDSSRTYQLAQALMDSVGPRLTATAAQRAGNDWLVKNYQSWGIEARNEQYGTWPNWSRGYTHIDLVAPRVRTLEGTMLAWSAGTKGPVTAAPVILPELADSGALVNWAPNAKGKFVLISFAEPSCRPDRQWQEMATPDVFTRFKSQRDTARAVFQRRLRNLGGQNRVRTILEQAGAKGILQSNWSLDYGVNKVFSANTQTVPAVDLSCEDYGLVYRLTQNNQGPMLRIDAQATFNGNAPLQNTIAMIRGSEKPNEYVMLSAHFDSWDAGSGATDNGTGTIVMMEAMRILKQVLPNPKRTILVGHWTSEEQGLNGSKAFVKDHPEIVNGMQALFNQDNGTGRVQNMSSAGFLNAPGVLASWLGRLPTELTSDIKFGFVGNPGFGGTDSSSFVCAGAPAFGLGSLDWGYGTYTWHTNRDTFDKIVFEELKRNATLTAMLAYQASEDPRTMPRDKRTVFPRSPQTGQPGTWPACSDGQRVPPATLGR